MGHLTPACQVTLQTWYGDQFGETNTMLPGLIYGAGLVALLLLVWLVVSLHKLQRGKTPQRGGSLVGAAKRLCTCEWLRDGITNTRRLVATEAKVHRSHRTHPIPSHRIAPHLIISPPRLRATLPTPHARQQKASTDSPYISKAMGDSQAALAELLALGLNDPAPTDQRQFSRLKKGLIETMPQTADDDDRSAQVGHVAAGVSLSVFSVEANAWGTDVDVCFSAYRAMTAFKGVHAPCCLPTSKCVTPAPHTHRIRWVDFFPPICISYSTGGRPKDAKGTGPGALRAAALVHYLNSKGLKCATGLQVSAGHDWRDFIPKIAGDHAQCVVLICLLDAAFFQSEPCLNEVFAALGERDKVLIIPIRCEDRMPKKDTQWAGQGKKAARAMYEVSAKLFVCAA